jgi:hypothetical protein
MAQESVVKDQLPPETIAAGDELTRRLRQQSDFGLVGSFWLYTSESNWWRLVIATPLVESRGPLYAYDIINHVLAEIGGWSSALQPYTVSVVSPNHPVVNALLESGSFEIQDLPPGPRPAPTVRMPRRITQSRVRDIFVEDALVYFLQARAA